MVTVGWGGGGSGNRQHEAVLPSGLTPQPTETLQARKTQLRLSRLPLNLLIAEHRMMPPVVTV